jgi:peptidyl-prolyl cis-trans isomerase SurA
MKKLLIATLSITFLSTAPLALPSSTHGASAAEIVYVVNGNAVTNVDINGRVAFLKLQRKKGNLKQQAVDEMIDQVLKLYESKRVGITVSNKEVAEAYARFAKSNKLSEKQLGQILGQAGVGAEHFKDFIRSQIAWGRTVQAKARAKSSISRQDLVRRMLERKDNKPSATEYRLQQVIFVIPQADRGKLMGRKRKEAEGMRARFSGCENTKQFAKGLVDVTVRDLGRVLEPELPADWEKFIKETQPGGVTKVRETERGLEFIALCSSKVVDDDRVAELTFRMEDSKGGDGEKIADDYLAEVRKKAEIVKR